MRQTLEITPRLRHRLLSLFFSWCFCSFSSSHLSLISWHFHQHGLHYLPVTENVPLFSADSIPTAGKRQAVVLEQKSQLGLLLCFFFYGSQSWERLLRTPYTEWLWTCSSRVQAENPGGPPNLSISISLNDTLKKIFNLAALGLRCFAWAFFRCGRRAGVTLHHGAQTSRFIASPVAVHWL